MNLPPFVYAKAFWEAVSWLLAGAVGLLVYFGVLPDSYAYGAATILAGILGFLKFFKITPELKMKAALKELERQGFLK